MGMSPWGSPLSVWADKRGLLPERDETDEMAYGKKMEPVLREWFVERFKAENPGAHVGVEEYPWMVRSIEYPWALANIDGTVRVNGVEYGLELKTADRTQAKHWRDGEMPDGYFCQVQHYCAVFNFYPGWYVFALVGKKPVIRYVPRATAFIGNLMGAERNLWEMVQAGEMPAPTGLDVDADVLALLYTGGGTETADLEAMQASLERHYRLGHSIKEMEAMRAELGNNIKAAMGNAKVGTAGDFKAMWSRFDKHTLDISRLRKEQPEIAEQYTTTEPSGRFTVAQKGTKE
jgi:predicted phage-related endonuclease